MLCQLMQAKCLTIPTNQSAASIGFINILTEIDLGSIVTRIVQNIVESSL